MIKQEQVIEEVKTTKNVTNCTIRSSRQQSDYLNNLYNDINSANPILPPGIHNNDHQHSLRIRHIVQRSKLNRTTFPDVRNRNWLNQTQSFLPYPNKETQFEVSQMQQQDQNLSEFRTLVAGKVLLYSRINNSKFNKLQRDKVEYFSSLFYNYKKEEIKSRKDPIFQYLPRIYKQMKPSNPPEDVLSFNSAFESGNLFCVFKCKDQSIPTYQLFMQNDINTKGCTQWFYFSIVAQRRTKFRLRIVNFYKPTSLYLLGMKILVSADQVDWKRIGTAIKYKRISLNDGKESYALEFIFEIENSLKEHYFSYGYPYTYSYLQNVLGSLSQLNLYPRVANKSIVCKTYLGNSVYMLTISNHLASKVQKQIIYIISRQHPGQTPGSFIVEGLIRALLSNRLEMEEIREKYTVKIVPMLNVDGVVNGNYRSNFSGNDVNRQWQQPSRKYHPQIYALKQQIIGNRKNVNFFLDIHAHSRKMNSFFYGSKGLSLDNRLYPFICSKLNKNISYMESTFIDDVSKKTTARVVLENEANIKKSLTFQASFYGFEDEEKKTRIHFKVEDLKQMGQSLALGIFYSEIGTVRYLNQIQTDKKKQVFESANRKSVSCNLGQQTKKSKKNEASERIAKNCARMAQKWRKQIQRELKKDNDDVISEGSSLDPQHFELTQLEEQQISLRSQIKKDVNNLEVNMSMISNFPEKQTIEECLNEEQAENSPMFKSQNQQKQKQKDNLKYTFFPIQSNLRNSLMVKQLQNELQMQRTHRNSNSKSKKTSQDRYIQGNKSTKLNSQVVQGKRFKSIEVEVKQATNYRNSIIEMKQALKYFMANNSYDYKSSDYHDYKAYMKSTANDGTQLVFSDRQFIARIKKKYTKI